MSTQQQEARARPDTAAALRKTAGDIDAAIKPLNVAFDVCGGCGLRHAQNYLDAQAHAALRGMADKLRRWADTLENPESADLPVSRRENSSRRRQIIASRRSEQR